MLFFRVVSRLVSSKGNPITGQTWDVASIPVSRLVLFCWTGMSCHFCNNDCNQTDQWNATTNEPIHCGISNRLRSVGVWPARRPVRPTGDNREGVEDRHFTNKNIESADHYLWKKLKKCKTAIDRQLLEVMLIRLTVVKNGVIRLAAVGVIQCLKILAVARYKQFWFDCEHSGVFLSIWR